MKNGKTFEFDTKEIKEILGEVPINDPSIMMWFKDYVKEGLQELEN